ncbi:MAG: TetR/AcrR family transcriptional regulator [Actinobacteria bacterium]|nr:TetR/AcrR family transcriptional regulator [Actinomycetota bacterium]MBI3687761.1 TetR/AcrR family transcriptional regulator [Actinomycetota bacterium]
MVGSDRRVRRTRAALNSALLDLIIEKGYEAVTVQDIIDRADVGRSTFYAHFRDKDDLLLSGAEILRPMIDGTAGDRPFGFSLELFRHARSHRLLYRAMAGRRAGSLFLKWFTDMVAGLVREDLQRYRPRPGVDVPLEVLVQFVTATCVSVLSGWLEGDARASADDVDRMFRTLALGGVAAAVDLTPTRDLESPDRAQ